MAFVDLSRVFKQNLAKIIIGVIVIALLMFLILGEIRPAINTIANKIAGG